MVGANDGSSRTPADTRVGKSTLRMPLQAVPPNTPTISATVSARRARRSSGDIDSIRIFMVSSMPSEGEPEGGHELRERRYHGLDVVRELAARYADLRISDDLPVDVLLCTPKRGEIATGKADGRAGRTDATECSRAERVCRGQFTELREASVEEPELIDRPELVVRHQDGIGVLVDRLRVAERGVRRRHVTVVDRQAAAEIHKRVEAQAAPEREAAVDVSRPTRGWRSPVDQRRRCARDGLRDRKRIAGTDQVRRLARLIELRRDDALREEPRDRIADAIELTAPERDRRQPA